MNHTYTVTLKGVNGKMPFNFHTDIDAYTFEGAVTAVLTHFGKSIPEGGIQEITVVLKK